MKRFSDAVEMNMYKRMLNECCGVRLVPMNIHVDTVYALPPINDIIFNRPATIVFWADNTKTVVKCGENDVYDPEKGLAMAIVKKVYGNKGNYYNLFSEWVEPELKYYSKDE